MNIRHYYQIHEVGCVQAAGAMFLSAYDIVKTPADIEAEVPMRSWPGKTELAGTPNQDIAAYFARLGLQVQIVSFDAWVTDLSWQHKDTDFIRSRLETASGRLTAPMIGRQGTELYIQAYLDYIKAGGSISVKPYPQIAFIKELLEEGPILTTVSYDVLHGLGKSVSDGPDAETSRFDDVTGTAPNHTIVISRQVAGMMEVYDPWLKPGIHLRSPDQVISAISAAQQECDNMLITARTRATRPD